MLINAQKIEWNLCRKLKNKTIDEKSIKEEEVFKFLVVKLIDDQIYL